jgi:hypothetical protein
MVGSVEIPRGAAPSTYSALAVVERQPGAITGFLGAFILRGLVMVPGMWVGGARGRVLWLGAFGSAASLSAALLLYYGYHHNQELKTGKPAPWHNGYKQWTTAI